jgi:hypothetical protein
LRFDILDEYSTVVPSGLGVFKQNRVVQYPATATRAVKSGAVADRVNRLLKILFKSAKACGQIKAGETVC